MFGPRVSITAIELSDKAYIQQKLPGFDKTFGVLLWWFIQGLIRPLQSGGREIGKWDGGGGSVTMNLASQGLDRRMQPLTDMQLESIYNTGCQ